MIIARVNSEKPRAAEMSLPSARAAFAFITRSATSSASLQALRMGAPKAAEVNSGGHDMVPLLNASSKVAKFMAGFLPSRSGARGRDASMALLASHRHTFPPSQSLRASQ